MFECQQCGECCSHLGLVFEIIEDYGDYSNLIRNQYTGLRQIVSVSESLHMLYDLHDIFLERPEACPFFRFNTNDGLYYCTVHLTRPEICQDYGCWRFLILDNQGNRVGRVMERRHLHTESESLEKIWEHCIRTLHEDDDEIWDRKMCSIIHTAGFKIRD
ncbi:MAG: YkgJ family cysteine cluster protein [Methanospirillum sp.]|uniref:YkgJ family cysteine cluster protein n=1 Tax=Methanospirillum sp. TaxID=45200 RepID=UPI00236BFAEC|nr:YkgJ family cysteine cluster protein [Methanospirillum sp.]MDD1730136.1 YkgJ family cysteine cluster protein [Methanospirillum sp.]